MGKRITVYDIAKELDISPSTVSRVLNKSTLISDERSRQILETAEKMGYQKRAIKKHVSRAILNIHLFLPHGHSTITHFFYNISELIESIQEGFGDVKLNFITRVNDGNLDFLERKKTGQIDGCVFAFTKPGRELTATLKEREIPYILLNRKARSGSYVMYDVSEGLTKIAGRLMESRRKDLRPCFIGYRGLPEISDKRYEVISGSFEAGGLAMGAHSRFDVSDFHEISQSVMGWVEEHRFNAVFAFNDIVAVSFLQTAQARGFRFPEDISLAGVDDSPIQGLLDRRIDTVSLSIHELGRTAGSWLNGYIIEKSVKPLRSVLTGEYLEGNTIFL